MKPHRRAISVSGEGHPERSRLALHACCGPCLIEPYDGLEAEGFDVTVVYYNPNIQPTVEYERRRETLAEYALARGIEFVVLPHDPAEWEQTAGRAESREERCRACYQLRIGGVAAWAAANGVGEVATTLTVSPYQDAQAIAEIGSSAAELWGIHYVDRDFRERYPEATRRSRELGMYRQNYCGCGPSEREAAAEREARRAARAAQKARRADSSG